MDFADRVRVSLRTAAPPFPLAIFFTHLIPFSRVAGALRRFFLPTMIFGIYVKYYIMRYRTTARHQWRTIKVTSSYD